MNSRINCILHFIKRIPTKCINLSKFYYSIFIWSSTCFGRHTAHLQESKTALAASDFSYVEGWWTCGWWTLSATYCVWQRPSTFHICKSRACQCSFRLLMMGGVSPEICWASYKYEIIKFWYILHLVGFFFMNCTMMHGSTNMMHFTLFYWFSTETELILNNTDLRILSSICVLFLFPSFLPVSLQEL